MTLVSRSSATYAPAAAQPTAEGKIIGALQVVGDTLLAGYGDYNVNTGPIKVGSLPLDDLEGTWTEGASLATEQVSTFRVLTDGRVIAPAIDPVGAGSVNGSNYAERDPGTGMWTDRRNGRVSLLGIHFFDVVECAGRLFMSGAAYEMTYGTGNLGGAIWVSEDDGATWSVSYSHFGASPAYDMDRFYYLAVIGSTVYAKSSPLDLPVKWTEGGGWVSMTDTLPDGGGVGKPFRSGWVTPENTWPPGAPVTLSYFDGTTCTNLADLVVAWDVGDDGALYLVGSDGVLSTVAASGSLTAVTVQDLEPTVSVTSMAVLPGSASFALGTAESALLIYEEGPVAFDKKTWVDAPEGWELGDDIPEGATPTDAEGFNDLEDRIEAVTDELATASGGGRGPENNRTAAAIHNAEITPLDTTKSVVVFLSVVGAGGGVTLGSYNNNTSVTRVVGNGVSESIMWIGEAGETYYCGFGAATVNSLYECTLG